MKAAAKTVALPSAEPDINAYVLAQGRLPRLGEAVPPFAYRGWLLYYVQLGVRAKAPEVIDRWHYHLRTLETGRLLDEPIPPVAFCEGSHDEGAKELDRWIDLVYNEVGSISAFGAVLDFLSWGLAVGTERPRIGEALEEKLYRAVDLEPLLARPFDYLGNAYQETKSLRWNNLGYYATPHNVVEMMTRMVMGDPSRSLGDGRDPRTAMVCDPAVGSGRMLLHASNYSFCLYGQDINPICCAMARINGALYAPWMSFPLPQRILNVALPPPPPASLPVPDEYKPRGRVYRIDDRRRQVGLFEFMQDRLEFDPSKGDE